MSKKTEKKATKPVVKAVVKKETAKKQDAKAEAKKTATKKTATKKADAKVKLTDNEVKNIVEMARTFRFFLLTLVPRQKSGSRGEAILKKVDECGRFISYVAERIGLSEVEKTKCECGKCECEKKADVKKTAKAVKKASNVKSSKK